MIGLVLNAVLGWWWADPVAGLIIVYYALHEAGNIHADHWPCRDQLRAVMARAGEMPEVVLEAT